MTEKERYLSSYLIINVTLNEMITITNLLSNGLVKALPDHDVKGSSATPIGAAIARFSYVRSAAWTDGSTTGSSASRFYYYMVAYEGNFDTFLL